MVTEMGNGRRVTERKKLYEFSAKLTTIDIEINVEVKMLPFGV